MICSVLFLVHFHLLLYFLCLASGVGEVESAVVTKLGNNGLRWTLRRPVALNGESLEGYMIRYAPVGSDDFIEESEPAPPNIDVTPGILTLRNLEPFTVYRFQISALSNFGRGVVVERNSTSPGKL